MFAQPMPKPLKYIRIGFLQALGGLLLIWLVAGIRTVSKWAFHLELTDKEVLTIQFVSAFAGLALLGLIGWLRFFRVRGKLRSVEDQLSNALKPTWHFRDDFDFDKRLGLYRHKTKPDFFCASCTPKEILSPLKEMPNGWRCMIKECDKWHPNPDYKESPEPPPSRRGLGLTFEDLDL
jgi:hypothetical protein